MGKKVAGIDEAGRGPVIGPMVIVGVLIDESKITELKKIGVTDSKLLSPKEREELFDEIINVIDKYSVKIISPETIDKYVYENKLNILEIETMAKIISELKPDTVYIDSPSKNTKRIVNEIKSRLGFEPEIIAENKADFKYPVVSAASIIAKVIRDKEIKKIKEKLNIDIGSGYPSDPITRKAIKENYDLLKDFIRKSWKTVRSFKQRKILDFFR